MYILKSLLTQNIAERHSVVVAFLTPQKFARAPHWYYWQFNQQARMNTTGAANGEHTFLGGVFHKCKGRHMHLPTANR